MSKRRDRRERIMPEYSITGCHACRYDNRIHVFPNRHRCIHEVSLSVCKKAEDIDGRDNEEYVYAECFPEWCPLEHA